MIKILLLPFLLCLAACCSVTIPMSAHSYELSNGMYVSDTVWDYYKVGLLRRIRNGSSQDGDYGCSEAVGNTEPQRTREELLKFANDMLVVRMQHTLDSQIKKIDEYLVNQQSVYVFSCVDYKDWYSESMANDIAREDVVTQSVSIASEMIRDAE
jgi:hypothetical protein